MKTRCRRLPLAALALAFLVQAGALPAGQDASRADDSLKRLAAAEPHFAKGVRAFSGGRTDAAEAEFLACVREMPEHAHALYYLANLAYIRKDYPKALAAMEKALAGLPAMDALTEEAAKKSGRAIGSYERLLASEWDNGPNCRTSRELESLSGELSDTKARLDLLAKNQAAARSRQKAHYLYFEGNIFFQLERFAEALGKFEEAIGINPRHANAYNNAAAIRYLAGDLPVALDFLARAEAQGLEDNINLKLKHLVYEGLGRPTEGILREDLSTAGDGGPGVERFALAFRNRDASLPPLYENCYLVYSRTSRQAILIDPGTEDPRIADFTAAKGLTVQAILNTHGHADHTGGDAFYANLYRAPIRIHEKDAKDLVAEPNGFLKDGEALAFEGLDIRVIHTPGHTPGSVSFLVGDRLFAGDTLFKNDIGKDARVQIIREKLLPLPGATRVCPGHGRATTIADEKANNPFLTK